MNIDPKHLIALHMIKQRNGLTAAAEALGTSQPALSRLVSDLEIRLGAPLFDRSQRPWIPTPFGESLAVQGGAVALAQNRASAALDLFKGGIGGEIRIGSTPFFGDSVLTEILASFQNIHSDVRIAQAYGYTEQLIRRVARHELDFAVCPIEWVDEAENLNVRQVTQARNIVACRKDHPLMLLSSIRPLALLDYGWISPPSGSPLLRDMGEVLNNLGVSDIHIAFSGGSLAATMSYLENSNCFTVLPEMAVKRMGRKFNIGVLPISFDTPRRKIAIITQENEVHSHTLTKFLEHLEIELPLRADMQA